MSFYGRTCGVCPAAGALAQLLGLHVHCIPQFRDCYIQGDHIVILARCGGVLREDYPLELKCVRALPTFVREGELLEDDTYTLFTFAVPTAHRAAFALLKHLDGVSRDPASLLREAHRGAPD